MKLNRTLWTIQGLLAALFWFAGTMKAGACGRAQQVAL
jgi:hypothetical protein